MHKNLSFEHMNWLKILEKPYYNIVDKDLIKRSLKLYQKEKFFFLIFNQIAGFKYCVNAYL
jgi:hypothetical protein